MKKSTIVMLFCFTVFFTSSNLFAQCKDIGQNNTNSYVKSNYDCTTGELWAYGYNEAGNFGTGNYVNVEETNKVRINDKVGNKKIIDYYFGLSNTYLLTSDNKVYASGYKVGNGSSAKINNFMELYFYKNSVNKITTIASVAKIDTALKADKYVEHMIKFTTSKSNIYYYFNNINWASCYPVYQWTADVIHKNFKKTTVYPVYYEKTGNVVNNTVINRKKQLVYSYITNDKNKIYISKKYKNNQIYNYRKFSKTKDIYYNYKNGKKVNGSLIYYKTFKEKKYKNHRLPTKRYNYFYNSKQQFYLRKGYIYSHKKNNKDYYKAIISNKKEYKRNSKGELKSNSNGKAFVYITQYKKGKAIRTYKYDYSKSGKMINKKIVKTRK